MSDTNWSDAPDLAPPRERARIWPWAIIALAVAGMLLIWGSRPQRTSNRGNSHPGVGKELTVFALQPLTGSPPPLDSADLHGKVTLVNFWGTWCPPCAIEFPHIAEIEQHFRGRTGFQFASVSASPSPREDADIGPATSDFLVQMKAKFSTYRDAQAVTRDHLDAV